MAFGRKKDAEPAADVAPVSGTEPAEPAADVAPVVGPDATPTEDSALIPEAWAARLTAPAEPDDSDQDAPDETDWPATEKRYAEAVQHRAPSHDEEW